MMISTIRKVRPSFKKGLILEDLEQYDEALICYEKTLAA